MKYINYIILLIVFLLIYFLFHRFVKRSILIKGVDSDHIYLGQTINLKNPDARALSDGIVLAAYHKNKKGGLHNKRMLHLLIYDDEYIPKEAVDNAKLLIDYQNVLALVGTWGTQNNKMVYQNVIDDRDCPLIGTYTATESMYSTFDKRVVITRDSNKNEMNTILRHIIESNRNKKSNICVFYQDDHFGTSCLNSITECITDQEFPINILFTGNYPSGTTFFYKQFEKMFHSLPYQFNNINDLFESIDAVICICTTIQKPDLIKYFKLLKPTVSIYTTSASGGLPNFKKKKMNTDNIYYTDILPDVQKLYPKAYKRISQEIRDYNESQTDNKVKLSEKFFIGWTVGNLIIQAIENIPHDKIARKTLLDSIYKMRNITIEDYQFGPYIDGVNHVGQKGICLYKYESKLSKFKYIKTYKSTY